MKLLIKYKSVEEQAEILRERGMIVNDISILENLNYSHLIYKYGSIFWDEELEKYKDGICLKHVYNLYLFHLEISKIMFEFITRFEQELKTHIAHVISQEDIYWYINKNNYSKEKMINKEINKFFNNLNILAEYVLKNTDSKYHDSKNVPMWILVDNMAFGQLRMTLKAFQNRDVIYNAMNLNIRKADVTLAIINSYRNQIFHGNELKHHIEDKKEGQFYKLITLFNIMKNKYNKLFLEIKDLYNKLDSKTIGIDKKEIVKKLKISGLFK